MLRILAARHVTTEICGMPAMQHHVLTVLGRVRASGSSSSSHGTEGMFAWSGLGQAGHGPHQLAAPSETSFFRNPDQTIGAYQCRLLNFTLVHQMRAGKGRPRLDLRGVGIEPQDQHMTHKACSAPGTLGMFL